VVASVSDSVVNVEEGHTIVPSTNPKRRVSLKNRESGGFP
jgi:hypothetical protein